MVEKDLIMLDLDYETRKEVISELGKLLHSNGYVHKEFIQAVLDREEEYPTGIPSEPGIALPHASSKLVKKAGIAVAILKNPVKFHQMDGSDEMLDVKIVIMLAIDNPKEHLIYLQRIMNIFKDDKKLGELQNSSTIDEAYDVLSYINS